MAWASNTNPSNGTFSRLRNMRDSELSSSEECLAYNGGECPENGEAGNISASTSPTSLPSNHQPNIAHSTSGSLPSGSSSDGSTSAPPPSPATPPAHVSTVPGRGSEQSVPISANSSIPTNPTHGPPAHPNVSSCKAAFPGVRPLSPTVRPSHPNAIGLPPIPPVSLTTASNLSFPPPSLPVVPPVSSSASSLPPSSPTPNVTMLAPSANNQTSPVPVSVVTTNTSNSSSAVQIWNVPSAATVNSSSSSVPTSSNIVISANNISSANTVNNAGPMYNWQATMTTVKERFAFLFNNEILSDVHFLVGKGDSRQRIPAHKFVLAVGSAVFDAMFNGQLSTRQEEIELPDVEPQAFLALLRFLYSDEVQIGPETVMTVLYTAKKYAVPALEQACVDFLKRNLSSDNAFMLLTQARLFDEPQLAALCLETIDKNTADSLSAEGFTDIDSNTLCMVLERDTLRIREAKLFQATVRWSEAECEREGLPVTSSNQRTVLGGALSLVRFPLMTIEEFAQGPAQSGILTDREVVQLFLHFTVNPKPPVNFLDVPRCCMTGKEQIMCRFQQTESRWGYSGTSDRIRFIVDRRIFVVGFGMYGSIHGPSEYEITIQIIHTATGKVCASNDTNFTSDGTVNTFRVMFKEPVEVLPNTNYTAYATLKGPDSHYGTKGVRKVTVECPSGDRVTFHFTYAAGNNNGTSVEDGQIPEIIFHT
ncbi:BTB/POZ domain-containing protein 1-like [Palaemon carinicauda]|uniref:BTB/POZ domain-containing protein 1-like n=1 Tax=Palaemon carinicauda TaxID=392227 RepID=UPI0035B6A7E4